MLSSLRLHLAYRNIKRLRKIVGVLLKHGFYPLMDRLGLTKVVSIPQRMMGRKASYELEGLSMAVRTRLAFEELGPTFIKLGQILSTRPDVVPEDFITEFLKLQDKVPPFPFSDIKDVIKEEFGRPADELFSWIDEEPVAAASIAQVHRARIKGGDEVVIKVRRPGIEETIDTDLSILRYIARLLVRYVPESRLYDPPSMVDEFARTIGKEMDFTLEASYMERFRQNFLDDDRVVVPRVYWDHTSKRVLTMEMVRGTKVDRIDTLRERGIDTGKVAHLIADVFFKQVFEFGLFHGDLHSGNIFVIDENTIALVDFGIAGRIDREMREHLADILISFVKEDFDGLMKVYYKMGILPEDIDKGAFKRDYGDIMLHYFGRPLGHVKIGELFMDYIRLAARYRVKLPRDLLLFDKCIIELEGLGRLLYPGINILKECEPYAARLVRARYSPVTLAKEGASTLIDLREFMNELPGQMNQIMKKILADRMRIEFFHLGLEDFMGEMDRSSNRLTFGVIIAALIIGSSLIIAFEAGPMVYGYPALGMAGFLIAAFLGLWLAFLVIKSGKY